MKDKRNVRILNSINSVKMRPGMFIVDNLIVTFDFTKCLISIARKK